jgi:nucleoside-triphosphatase THEP1
MPARKNILLTGQPGVGKTTVIMRLADFEELVLPELARRCDLAIIQEIGKLECFSSRFVSAARALLDGAVPVVATVAVKGGAFITEVKAKADC